MHPVYNNFFLFTVGPQYVQGMWNFICPDLLKAIDCEPETEVLTELMFAMAKVSKICSREFLEVCF